MQIRYLVRRFGLDERCGGLEKGWPNFRHTRWHGLGENISVGLGYKLVIMVHSLRLFLRGLGILGFKKTTFVNSNLGFRA